MSRSKKSNITDGQIHKVEGIFVRKSEYKDKPMIQIAVDERIIGTRFGTAMQFGVAKAKLVLAAVPALQKFVDNYSTE